MATKATLVQPELFSDLFALIQAEYPEVAGEPVIIISWSDAGHGIQVNVKLRGASLDLLVPDRMIPEHSRHQELANMISDTSNWKAFFHTATQRVESEGHEPNLVFKQQFRRYHG